MKTQWSAWRQRKSPSPCRAAPPRCPCPERCGARPDRPGAAGGSGWSGTDPGVPEETTGGLCSRDIPGRVPGHLGRSRRSRSVSVWDTWTPARRCPVSCACAWPRGCRTTPGGCWHCCSRAPPCWNRGRGRGVKMGVSVLECHIHDFRRSYSSGGQLCDNKVSCRKRELL